MISKEIRYCTYRYGKEWKLVGLPSQEESKSTISYIVVNLFAPFQSTNTVLCLL